MRLGHDPTASHEVPIQAFTGTTDHAILECHEYGLPFLIDCDFDAAKRLLRHLYPAGFTAEPGIPERDRLVAFDQIEFFDATDSRVSMGEFGFLYVPADCAGAGPAQQGCRLHVALNRCRQYRELIGDDFDGDAGYNAWAEANRFRLTLPAGDRLRRPIRPHQPHCQSAGLLGLVGLQRSRLLPAERQADARCQANDRPAAARLTAARPPRARARRGKPI